MQNQQQSGNGNGISGSSSNNVLTLKSQEGFTVQVANGVTTLESESAGAGTQVVIMVLSGSVEARIHPDRSVTIHPFVQAPMAPMNFGGMSMSPLGSGPMSMSMPGMPPMVMPGGMSMNTTPSPSTS